MSMMILTLCSWCLWWQSKPLCLDEPDVSYVLTISIILMMSVMTMMTMKPIALRRPYLSFPGLCVCETFHCDVCMYIMALLEDIRDGSDFCCWCHWWPSLSACCLLCSLIHICVVIAREDPDDFSIGDIREYRNNDIRDANAVCWFLWWRKAVTALVSVKCMMIFISVMSLVVLFFVP